MGGSVLLLYDTGVLRSQETLQSIGLSRRSGCRMNAFELELLVPFRFGWVAFGDTGVALHVRLAVYPATLHGSGAILVRGGHPCRGAGCRGAGPPL